MLTSASLLASCFFVAMVLAAVAPIARAETIVACDGVSSGTWNSDFASGGGTRIASWGAMRQTCYGSLITGLPRVKSFTYWVTQNEAWVGYSPTAVGVVIESNTTATTGNSPLGANQVLAMVDITDLLPTTNAYVSVTADFGSMVALDASKTYMLAFCATSGGTSFAMDGVAGGNSFRYCSNGRSSCTIRDAPWRSFSTATLRSNFVGDCSPSSSSASQLAAPQWAGALARVAALLAALWR